MKKPLNVNAATQRHDDVYASASLLYEAVPHVGGCLQRVTVNSRVSGDDLVDGDGGLVLGESHHFDTWLETRAFLLIDHIDLNGVGFWDYVHGLLTKIVLRFVGNGHTQVENLQFLVVQGL